MLMTPTLDKLRALKLTGMVHALEEQTQMGELDGLSFEERLGLMVDREITERDNRRLKNRLQQAKLRVSAEVEDIDFRHPRGLDKSVIAGLVSCEWIHKHLNLLITGPTGCGKTYLACALGQKACREGLTVQYIRMPRLSYEMGLAKADGRYGKMLATFSKLELLILDDFGITPLTAEGRQDILEILEERHGRRSTLVTSQLPVKSWHEYLADASLADAILERLVHNAHKIALKGESMRKRLAP